MHRTGVSSNVIPDVILIHMALYETELSMLEEFKRMWISLLRHSSKTRFEWNCKIWEGNVILQ